MYIYLVENIKLNEVTDIHHFGFSNESEPLAIDLSFWHTDPDYQTMTSSECSSMDEKEDKTGMELAR